MAPCLSRHGLCLCGLSQIAGSCSLRARSIRHVLHEQHFLQKSRCRRLAEICQGCHDPSWIDLTRFDYLGMQTIEDKACSQGSPAVLATSKVHISHNFQHGAGICRQVQVPGLIQKSVFPLQVATTSLPTCPGSKKPVAAAARRQHEKQDMVVPHLPRWWKSVISAKT